MSEALWNFLNCGVLEDATLLKAPEVWSPEVTTGLETIHDVTRVE